MPEQVATAAPETEVQTPETAETEVEKKPATFTQEELDAAISKRLAHERRKWKREQQTRPPAPPAEVPPIEQFESTEAYAEALAEKKAHELLEKRKAQEQEASVREAYLDRVEAAIERYPDYEQMVTRNQNVPISQPMAEAIMASEVGPDIAYYLASNTREAAAIYALPPILQAKEIGKLEAKLAAAPPVKRTTKAPDPISPVKSRQSSAPSYDTTDPRSVQSMSVSEWIEAERQRQIRKLKSS